MKKSYIFRLSLAVLLLTASLPIRAQIFYKVKGPEQEKPSYLFGTHHIAPNSLIDSIPGVRQALDSTSAIVVETLLDDLSRVANEIRGHMLAPADSTLTSLYSPAEFSRLDSIYQTVIPGMSLHIFNAFKPMQPAMAVSMALAADDLSQTGQLDSWFMLYSRNHNKKLIGLEAPEYQASLLFDSVAIREQAQMFARLLSNLDEERENARKLNAAYLAFDLEKMLSLSDEESDSLCMDVLLKKRNEEWLRVLPGIMKENPAFIAVGALHLAGPEGLVARLRSLGYTVEAAH